MSRYDERMLKPSSNSLHFELIPRYLISIDSQTQPMPSCFKFQLCQGEKLCSETKLLQTQVDAEGQIIVTRAYLNFHIVATEPRDDNKYEIKLWYVPQCQTNVLSKLGSSDAQHQHQIALFGACFIEIQTLVHDFTGNGIQHARFTKDINSAQALVFDLFIGKTRFTLEKYIRSLKSEVKQYKKQNAPPCEIRAFSSASYPKTRNSKMQHKNFISPHKSLQKDRKLIVRVSKNLNKKAEVISEQNSLMFQKSMSKQNELKVDFKPSPRQISKSNELSPMPKSFELQRQFTPKCDNLLQMPHDADLLRDIEAMKSISDYKSDTKDSKNKRPILQIKTPTKTDICKQHNKELNEVNKTEHVKQKGQGLSLKHKLSLAAFLVISFLILLQVMTPNRRV